MRNIYERGFLAGALIVLFSTHTFGQKNWMDGWIVKKGGEKEEVQINYENWDKSPDRVSVKVETGTTTYGVDDISEFFVNNEYYKSYSGTIVNLPIKDEHLSYDPEIKYSEVRAFLRYIYKDDLSLLVLKDVKSKSHFFVQRANEKPAELEFYKFKVDEPMPNTILKNERYKLQMSFFFESCSNQDLLRRAQYDLRSISRSFLAYYECSNRVPTYQIVKEKSESDVGLSIGLTNTMVKYDGSFAGGNSIQRGDFENTSSVYFGLFGRFVVPRTQGKFSFDAEMGVQKLSLRGDYYQQAETYTDEIEYTVDANYLRVALGVGLKVASFSEKSELLIGAGVLTNFGKTSSKEDLKRYDSNGTLTVDKKEDVFESDDIRNQEQGFYTKLKYHYGSFGAFGRVDFGNGYSNLSTLSIKSRRLVFGLEYAF